MLHPPIQPVLHPLFETAGYASGYAVYRRNRRRQGDALNDEQRWSVVAAAAVGALLGSRILGLLEQLPRLHLTAAQFLRALVLPGGGKTIVGGLLGGWLAVELAKKCSGIRSRTGDLFALPLCLGIAIGRIGCFLAGLADDTFGKPTTLPWATDFGDGVGRHPTQLYEILFLAALSVVLHRLSRRPHPAGLLFRIFLASYLAWRFLIDFLKPQPTTAGLNAIQWACLLGLAALLVPVASTNTALAQPAGVQ